MYDISIRNDIYDWAKNKYNNVVTRQLQECCQSLRVYDQLTPLNTASYTTPELITCYGCNKIINTTHPVYVFSCRSCGNLFQEYRHLTRDLTAHVAVIIGGRTKLGHQIAIKLLVAGAKVIITTRFPERATDIFSKYPEWPEWQKHLVIYPSSLDLDVPHLSEIAKTFGDWCMEKFGRIDVFVMCAAQTIRIREKAKNMNVPHSTGGFNRYQDAKYVETNMVNSWQMRLDDLVQGEMEEVYRINAVAPLLFVQQLIPLFKNSECNPYIVNVHAREGLFQVRKNSCHIHTNMAKAALAMFTKCLKREKLLTHLGKNMWIHGCDPGWISIDEYYVDHLPWPVPPIDEIDGAARILYPVMAKLKGSFERTRRHYKLLHY